MRLVSTCNSFTTDEQRADVENFFTENPAPAAERTIRQALERMGLKHTVAGAESTGPQLVVRGMKGSASNDLKLLI